MWKCKCDCGCLKTTTGMALRQGKVRSCGCLHKQVMTEIKKKYNKYDLSGEYGVGWTTNTNQEFYFDLEDYEKIKDYSWLENDQGYIVAHNICSDNPKIVRMHRLLTNFEYKIVDHINCKRFDNRKSNLRYATRQTNNINRNNANINNKIGIKGVSELQNGTYMARIEKNGDVLIKTFPTKIEAKEWRDKKELDLYGEYSYKEAN